MVEEGKTEKKSVRARDSFCIENIKSTAIQFSFQKIQKISEQMIIILIVCSS